MINNISSWAGSIITAVIIATILEMILPNGNSKKYIKTVIGVYILYTIISPVIKLINKKDIELNYSDYFNTSEQNLATSYDVYRQEDIYNKEVEKQIKSDVEKIGYFVQEVDAKINLDTGKIEYVILSLNENVKEENSININIEDIEIGENKENEVSQGYDDIKQMLNTDYGVDLKNITIK